MGGAIVIALFAALIVPWFVDWDDYKTNFEQEAGRILGHPVQVIGSASASILPSPSLTFTNVQVSGASGEPMMTVDRFEVTIELMPLLQGEIRVVAMKLEKPVVRVSVDEEGAVDWLKRPVASEAFDPDKVALAAVQISDGAVAYSDARTGVALDFKGITASVEARSLAGPWKADGSYIAADTAVPFHLATGRRLDDGTIRLKADFSPPQWPVDISADGVVSQDPAAGLTYGGTYAVTELVENVSGEATPDGEEAGPAGWRSEGAFTLNRDHLVVDKAVLSSGPPDRPSSVAGALTLNFGRQPSFTASAEARQLDLDRALGGGPTEPVEVATAAQRFVAWLTELPVPDMPGTITFNVPAIVVGGSVIQDVSFAAAPAAAGWEIEGFSARLPGQASISADGVLTTDGEVGFVGKGRLAILQPATFAAWWRGGAGQGAGRTLAAFDISGESEIAPGRISVSNIDARIGDATITGRFAWSEAARDHHRHLGTDLKADRIDFAQVKALAELLVGRDLTGTSVLADSYSVRLAAGAFQFDDIRMKDVSVDASYTDDVLTVVQIAVGDLGGSNFRVTGGRIEGLTTRMHGQLEAQLEATTLDGIALIAGRVFPDSDVLQWLGRASAALTPAAIKARIVAPAHADGTGIRVAIENGVAGSTTFDIEVESNALKLADWRNEAASVSLVVDSPDSADLARQVGLAAATPQNDSGAHVEIRGAGIPKDGLETTVVADFAGVVTNSTGRLAFASGFTPTFAGSFSVSTDDLGPLVATAGLGPVLATDVAVEGTISTSGGEADLEWQNGRIADRTVSGKVKFGRGADQNWRLNGDLAVDDLDLGWLMSLGLGSAPLPTGNSAAPWSKKPFGPPGYGQVSGKLIVAAEHLAVGDSLDIANAKLSLALQPQRIDLDLTEGHLAGGKAGGGLSVQNVDGNANLTGQINLSGATLESFIWRRDGRAVATGVFDVSANFEGTGRSPAALVSSMTGGGAVSVRNGEALYVNPNTARMVIRAADLGQEFTEDALRMTLAEQIDADSLRFGETGAAFAIAAGALRLKGLSARADKTVASGNAVLDLNTMTLDSDWTLTFDPGDAKVEGTDPKVGLIFRGPLASPERIIDALPFASYLNTRGEARILEILAMEESDHAERERLARLTIKLKQDRERTERLAREAAETEQRTREIAVAVVEKLQRLHVEREILTDERIAAALKRAAELADAARVKAEAALVQTAEHAGAERARAIALAGEVAPLVAADEKAALIAKEAAAQLVDAQSAADSANESAAKDDADADAAEAALINAANTEAIAQQALAKAEVDRTSSETRLRTATEVAAAAAAAAETAEKEAIAAADSRDAAGKAASDALSATAGAADALATAEAALGDAQTIADANAESEAKAARETREALAQRARLQATARLAAEAAGKAETARDAARAAVDQAEIDAAAAATAASEAARSTATMTPLQIKSRQAEADHARAVLEGTRATLAAAESTWSDVAEKAKAAQSAVADANALVEIASTATAKAADENDASFAAFALRSAARDGAARVAADRQAAAEQAGSAFDAAQTNANAATDRVATARADADAAADEQAAAVNAVATSTSAVGPAAVAVEAAVSAREQAVSAAMQARQRANASGEAATLANRLLAERVAVNTTAAAAAEAAREARVLAEEAAALAEASASQAEADALAAAARAKAASADAEAATLRLSEADRPAQGADVPRSRPRRQPVKLAPDAFAGDQPLVIVPGQ